MPPSRVRGSIAAIAPSSALLLGITMLAVEAGTASGGTEEPSLSRAEVRLRMVLDHADPVNYGTTTDGTPRPETCSGVGDTGSSTHSVNSSALLRPHIVILLFDDMGYNVSPLQASALSSFF